MTDERPTIAGTEPYRPQIHFTPHRNWINDPNGLVWFDGEYHLFFQYNPKGMDWGNMCWGHAVSDDLKHWRELPVAIPETDQMIFSGSIVVDHDNVSGLGDGIAAPLIAIFTAYDSVRSIQSQHLAYSHDRGRSFIHYAGNPIIDLDLADFRDPKVFYHADSAAWVMVVALARDHVVQFYRSSDLLDWTLAGTFGPAGSTSGQWECPDLVEVPIEGEDGASAWVLKVDVDVGLTDGGSGAQYFVGDFDGYRFTIDPVRGDADGLLVDQGPDFYAAITWSNLPDPAAGPIWIGWQSNHQTGRYYPTDPWRGAMSLPRRLFLYPVDGGLRLGQVPLLDTDIEVDAGAGPVAVEDDRIILSTDATSFQHRFRVATDAVEDVTIALVDDDETVLHVVIEATGGRVVFERPQSAIGRFDGFDHLTVATLPPASSVDFHIIVDGSLVEIFLNGGRSVYSGSIFPRAAPQLVLRGTGVADRLQHLGGGRLASTVEREGVAAV